MVTNMRLIDADALNIKKYTQWFDDVNDRRSVERMIREAPTVDVEPVRYGEWGKEVIVGYDGVNPVYARPCSECGYEMKRLVTRYCPNCGAKMDREAKHEENKG